MTGCSGHDGLGAEQNGGFVGQGVIGHDMRQKVFFGKLVEHVVKLGEPLGLTAENEKGLRFRDLPRPNRLAN